MRVCTTGESSCSRSRFLPRFEVFAAVLVCTPVQGSRSDFKILAAVRLVVVTAVRFYVGSRFYTSAVQDFQVDHDSTEVFAHVEVQYSADRGSKSQLTVAQVFAVVLGSTVVLVFTAFTIILTKLYFALEFWGQMLTHHIFFGLIGRGLGSCRR